MKIYYSIHNCGDGSAVSIFVDSRKLAEWDQDHLDEGWGEPSWGQLDVTSESAITVDPLFSAAGYYLWKELDEYWNDEDKKEFEAEFFPKGVPKFYVLILDDDDEYYHIYANAYRHYKVRGWSRELKDFEITEAGRLELQKRLNK